MNGTESVRVHTNPPVRWRSLAIFVLAVIPIYLGITYLVSPATELENSAALYVAIAGRGGVGNGLT